MDLKLKNKFNWQELIDKRFVAVYIALGLVLVINQIVFSVLLHDRERAKAFTAAVGAQFFNTLAGGNVPAGTNNKLVADFWFPDANNSSASCNYTLTGNPCVSLVDADGIGSPAAGTDDDSATNVFQLIPPNTKLLNILLQNSDKICTDSMTAPTCVYYDPDSTCVNNGNEIYVIGAGCAAGDTLVGPGAPNWIHSELINANGKWDYCGGPTEPGCGATTFNASGTLYFENAGKCGGTNPGSFEADKEPVWDDVNGDGIFTPATDTVYWDPTNCLRGTNVCMGGGCTGTQVNSGNPITPLFLDDPSGACGGTTVPNDGVWQSPEPLWSDVNGNGIFDTAGGDFVIWDPNFCLPPNAVGKIFRTPSQLTESLWLDVAKEDTVLVQGSYWNGSYERQWQRDLPNPYTHIGGKESFRDLNSICNGGANNGLACTTDADCPGGSCNPSSVFTGAEPVVADKDENQLYTDAPDILMDADGAATAGIGTNDDTIADAAGLVPVYLTGLGNSLCINTLGVGLVGNNVIMYIDGSGGADCIPGNGGTDILIRDDTSTGLPGIIAGLGTFPFTFFPGGLFLSFYDANSNGAWDYCDPAITPACGASQAVAEAATESLWMNGTGLINYNPHSPNLPIEADGTLTTGAGADDDALVRGLPWSYLQPADNVCGAYNLGVTALEDLYVDGNGNCIPGDGGADIILQDVTADGLLPGTVFGGTWFSFAGTLAFNDFLPPGPGQFAWTYAAGAAGTETLWLPINYSDYKYSSSADTDVYSMANLFGNDQLTFLYGGTVGPSGHPIIFADADGSNSLTATDTILEDNGNIATGPLGGPGNNRIDRQADRINYWTIKNAGTATGSDIPRLYLWEDNILGNGVCDLGVGPGADDTLRGTMSWNGATNTWDLDNSIAGIGVKTLNRWCISADFSPFATNGRTFIPQIPQLTDGINFGLHDPGEVGWFFYSLNDGPDANITLPYTFTIISNNSGGGSLSPIPPTSPTSPTPPTNETGLILQDPTPAPALPPDVSIGTLVKRADMNSIYFIDQDNRRHAFPNESVYFSYYPDFSGINIISSATMASIPLGQNVTMRPGTYLVKIQSDPKVYAVEPYGVLKWVSSEQIATSLYGADWNNRIVDVEPTFFINYQIGSSITEITHPTGSVFSYQGDSKVYYVEQGKKRYVSPEVLINNKFQDKFIIRNLVLTITYADGVDLPSQGMETIMTLR